MQKNKKGQALGGLSNSIMVLVVAIILLVLGIVIVQELRDTDTVAKANAGRVDNETVTTVTGAGDSLARSSSPGCAATLLSAVNATGQIWLLPLTNFTITGCRVFSISENATINNSNINFTYDYTYGDEAYVAANASITGLSDFSDFMPLIVIALAASVIIGLILAGFAYRRREER